MRELHLKAVLPALVGALVAGFVGVAAAQDGVEHEFVPNVSADEGIVLATSGGTEPAAITYRGELLPAPRGGGLQADEQLATARPTRGRTGDFATPVYRPDRQTSLDGTLNYYEAFTPAIAPFKRQTSLDVVVYDADGRTPVLGVARPTRHEVPIEGAEAPAPDLRSRDRFWGSLVVDFSSGRTVPLPSVSPESRILTLRTEPETLVRIEKDGADNFYVTAVASAPPSHVRVTFLTDAPKAYFGAPIPDGPADMLASEATALPAALAREALGFASELGLRRGASLRETLGTLVGYFRSFVESTEPPTGSGDIYLDLARGRKGVCRHRAYAFVITAIALGIAARFEQNEAHAWVEVRVPDAGWMRVDLGGAANALEAHNTDDRPVYEPASPDPFPRPTEYEQSYSQLRGQVSGLRPEDSAGGSGSGRANGSPGQAGSGARPAGGMSLPARPDGAQSSLTPRHEDDQSGEVDQPPGVRIPVDLVVETFYREVFRGRELRISGHAQDRSGHPLGGLRIEASVAAMRTERSLLLGVTVTRPDGSFAASFGVPNDVPVGDYRLVVVTPGDAQRAPAMAP